ncbi:MAG: PKD domain-containing protein [Candidatus Nitrosocosmicus sp.]|nr:PKD domain-containing protein [Candidatus Nitrosocosmicus sp.]
MEITDCIQSHHYLTFTTLASGFIPNTRIFAFYTFPESNQGWGSSTLTDLDGNWERQDGHLSSDDIPNGIWNVEAYNVDDNLNRLPNSPYATTEFETPCPFLTTPPDTELYATVNEKQTSSGESVTSNSIHFGYQIKDSFTSFARFDCKLDEGQYEDCTTIKCENPNSCGLNSRGTVMDGYSEKDYHNLALGTHVFRVKATDDSDNTDPTPAKFTWIILGPVANAGHDQSVRSDELVQLDGSNSSDPNGSTLTYSWNQTMGPHVILNNADSVNPTFVAPKTSSDINLNFRLTVTNEEGIASDPDEIIVTVIP